jgi:hypothetical protein
MRYFKTLPKVAYKDKNGHVTLLTNILTRVKVIPTILNNPLIYYKYDIKDSDTPEIIADKYYGDSYYYWIILLVNEIQHPQWSWPLSSNIFDDYIAKKYVNVDVNDIYYYEKILTKNTVETEEIAEERVIIDKETYDSLIESTQIFTFNGITTEITTSKRIVTYYLYEQELNESKRSIKLLNSKYLNNFINQFEKLYNKF